MTENRNIPMRSQEIRRMILKHNGNTMNLMKDVLKFRKRGEDNILVPRVLSFSSSDARTGCVSCLGCRIDTISIPQFRRSSREAHREINIATRSIANAEGNFRWAEHARRANKKVSHANTMERRKKHLKGNREEGER